MAPDERSLRPDHPDAPRLTAADVPAVRVCEEIEQPLLADAHPVSFWHTVTGGEPEPTHVDLAGTYGFDVRTWPGYPVLREVRELTMTTWIMTARSMARPTAGSGT